jgi:hypothetical protein
MTDEVSFFSTGMARSGTNLVSKILSSNSSLHCVLGVNVELYRSVRDRIFQSASPDFGVLIPKGSAFSHFFGKPSYLDALNYLFAQNFELEFSVSEFEFMRDKALRRSPHDSPDLKPILGEIATRNSVDYLVALVELTRKNRGIPISSKIGFHESWHIEMFPALQKSFPKAKFLIILRDVRGSYSSHKYDTLSRPEWRASIFDYARQFRKYAALADYLSRNMTNCKLIRYEDLMINPTGTISDLCNFLEVDYQNDMLNPRNHVDPNSLTAWQGNSGYGNIVAGFDPLRSTRWKAKLENNEIKGLELMCQLGLKRSLYELEFSTEFPNAEIKNCFQSLSGQANVQNTRWNEEKLTGDSVLSEEETYANAILSTPESELSDLLKEWFSPDFFLVNKEGSRTNQPK